MNVIILAAGLGKRMQSSLPKVLHCLGGKPMLSHVISTAKRLNPEQITVVYGQNGALVRHKINESDLIWVEQKHQLGTGHAVLQTLPLLSPAGETLILYGDVPLLQPASLRPLLQRAQSGSMALLTAELLDPSGYGRIIRGSDGLVMAIIEDRDATSTQKNVTEINTGVLSLPTNYLHQWIPHLKNDNATGEYYLTDLVRSAVKAGVAVVTSQVKDSTEILGVNTKNQLGALERIYQRQQAEAQMATGVTLADPNRFDVRGELHCGQDVFIDVGCVFEGTVKLADGVSIGPYCILKNTEIAAHTEIAAFTHLEGASIGSKNRLGPYARVRPGTVTSTDVCLGNFVEVKASTLGANSKANHLAYLGDATIGSHVNIGAGTITCNYDGENKHRTLIGNQVFIGSDTHLIAPVTVGSGATIAAGTTVWRNVPEQALVLNPKDQQHRLNWIRPKKTKD